MAPPQVGMNASSVSGLPNLFTSGSAYVNVHTQQHNKGEIRGQIGPMYKYTN